MKISELIEFVQLSNLHNASDLEITAVVEDSRAVIPGAIFVARRGREYDGHRFIQAALDCGAAAIVGEIDLGKLPESSAKMSVPYLQVPDASVAVGNLAAAFYDFPAHDLVMIGVTGTDGKTTTCNLIHNVLRTAGIPTGLISTVNAVIGDEVVDTGFHVTTPDAAAVQSLLSQMVAAGMTHCVLEATSHGLAQHRLNGCEFDIAVLTNITHEHLDYHGSLGAYLQAKNMLFDGLSSSVPKAGIRKLAILNRDDECSYSYIRERLEVACVDYGLRMSTNYQGENVRVVESGTCFDVISESATFQVDTALIGEYNVSNCLAAVAVARSGLDIGIETIQSGISTMPSIPGRMEYIDVGQEFDAVVDFAHTPNSLRELLRAVKEIISGRVIVVFGSAGLRDTAKRSLMGSVAAELADVTVITAEDPRTESPLDIMAEIAAGCVKVGGIEGETFWRMTDRAEAIKFAVDLAGPGDIVLACGKAHEQSMCFGAVEYPWDDRVTMRAAVAERMGTAMSTPLVLPTSAMFSDGSRLDINGG